MCPLYGPVKATVGQLAMLPAKEQTVIEEGCRWQPLQPEPPGDSLWLNLCCRSDCSIHTQLLKHQKSLIACSKSVSVCTADLPSARKQRAKRGDTADTLSILSLNNTFVFCQQTGFKLHHFFHWLDFLLSHLWVPLRKKSSECKTACE